MTARTALGANQRAETHELGMEVTQLGSRLLRVAGGHPTLRVARDQQEPLLSVGPP